MILTLSVDSFYHSHKCGIKHKKTLTSLYSLYSTEVLVSSIVNAPKCKNVGSELSNEELHVHIRETSTFSTRH